MFRLILSIVVFFTLIVHYSIVDYAQNTSTVLLNEKWLMKPASPIVTASSSRDIGQKLNPEGYQTYLPNTVLNALRENAAIDDPFYGTNEKHLQWLEKQDWIFEKHFDISSEIFEREQIDLILRGVDTYAKIYVNDSLILSADNMFRTWQANIKSVAKQTDNILRIEFQSPVNVEKDKAAKSPVDYPDVYNTTRVYSRKAQFHYGWDWGPRFISCGLTSAEIRAWNGATLKDVFVKQTKIEADSAHLQVQITINATQSVETEVEVKVNGKTFSQKAQLAPGLNLVPVEVYILEPQWWWTHDLGTPHLYSVEVKCQFGQGLSDIHNTRIGLRTIELVTEKDDKGKTFHFKLNGKPIFAKGANYIPQHFFQEKVKPQDNQRTIEAAIKGNMNMLRIWGGGIYETDYFYQLCDEKGILIWQDFMYACAMYPGDTSFLDNAKAEAIEQVQRLRNHPCIALWCGNNEINEAWHNWGWQPRFNPDQKEIIWTAYQSLFNKILPEAVSQFADNVPYWESSPSFGRYDNKSYTEGDNHDWFVWHDEKPFEHFEQRVPRFMSEYGFQSFPNWTTIETFALPEERELTSEVMLWHQKHPKGNQLIKKYMERDFRTPQSFKDFVYVSQLLQAHGIGKAIEAQRRAKPYCMGTLYWQLNDVWQVASWSSIDNFGRWKALQYKVKEVYDNILISPVVSKNDLRVHVVNDTATFKADLLIQSFNFVGKKIFEDLKSIEVATDTSGEFYNVPIRDLVQSADSVSNVYVLLTLKRVGQEPIQRVAYLTSPKNLSLQKPTIYKNINLVEGGFVITLNSPILCKNVMLSSSDLQHTEGFEDNFFDLLPNQPKTIFYKTSARIDDFIRCFDIRSLVDTY